MMRLVVLVLATWLAAPAFGDGLDWRVEDAGPTSGNAGKGRIVRPDGSAVTAGEAFGEAGRSAELEARIPLPEDHALSTASLMGFGGGAAAAVAVLAGGGILAAAGVALFALQQAGALDGRPDVLVDFSREAPLVLMGSLGVAWGAAGMASLGLAWLYRFLKTPALDADALAAARAQVEFTAQEAATLVQQHNAHLAPAPPPPTPQAPETTAPPP